MGMHTPTWLCVQYWDRQQCTPERFHVRVDMRGMLVLTCVQVGPPARGLLRVKCVLG